MSTHTPGPWPLETVPTSAGICHKIGSFPGRDDDRPTAACVYVDGIRLGIDDCLPRAQELLANAHLIAAAPDLLAALEGLMDAVPTQTNDRDWWPDELTKAMTAARKALDKAEGQQ